ncbi:hypothetical protein [Janibacter massiliensis]|uniref:hypothetical protein n=1 Tax=Janibacter massiliensis TaxID=2058291 RepID=UPI000D0F301D|nr:hypothetical protein [Janibacter massiliensis]
MQRLIAYQIRLTHAVRSRMESDRGDVPGWVLITLMTAGLVTALWAIADDALKNVFQKAISSTQGP